MASVGSAFVLVSGSLTWLRRPRLASPTSTTGVEACHPLGDVCSEAKYTGIEPKLVLAGLERCLTSVKPGSDPSLRVRVCRAWENDGVVGGKGHAAQRGSPTEARRMRVVQFVRRQAADGRLS